MFGVTPETLVLTSNGYESIGSLEGKEVDIWNGESFETTRVVKVDENRPIVNVTTKNTLELECTEDHQFYVQPGLMPDKLLTSSATTLEEDMKLPRIPACPITNGGAKSFPHAYSHGFYSGAERYQRSRLVVSRAAIYGLRKVLHTELELNENITSKFSLHFVETLPNDFEVPLSPEYSTETKLEWLAGLFDAGLFKRKAKPIPIWHFYSDDVDFLYRIRLLLQTLGVDSRHIKNDDAKALKYYSLRIRAKALETLRDLGIPTITTHFEDIHIKPNGPNGTLPSRIRSVDSAYRTADVYNFESTTKKAAVFNGIYTASN